MRLSSNFAGIILLLLLGHVQGFTSIQNNRIRQPTSSIVSLSGSPPAFSIVDEDDDIQKPPPAFTIDGDDSGDEKRAPPRPKRLVKPPKTAAAKRKKVDTDNDDDETSQNVPLRPRRPRPIRQPKKIRITSWMEKNEKFTNGSIDDDDDDDAVVPQNARQKSSPSERSDRKSPKNSESKTFRQDFRGTRVFVQGIPPGVSWQDLKDHFRVAGDVVFASVSVDPQTGMSKGHGIVQYETTEMARHAINIMRENPLNGSPLFVREDYQDDDENARLHSGPRKSTLSNVWKCANEDNAAYMSHDELASIKSLLKARDDARKRKQFDVSDRIRDDLKLDHGVFVDDRLKMWWTAIDGNKAPQTIKDIKGDGRWNLKPWRQIPTSPENDMCVDPDLVEGLLKQRDIARREKDFRTADTLLEQARTSPDGGLELRIHDESRTWRIWTEAPPPQPVEHRISSDPIQARKDAAKQCIEIVKENAPEKMDEIFTLLKKFPGREFQMLKRLKQQYK